jgi:hypothetical protein
MSLYFNLMIWNRNKDTTHQWSKGFERRQNSLFNQSWVANGEMMRAARTWMN